MMGRLRGESGVMMPLAAETAEPAEARTVVLTLCAIPHITQ
jgi:hypothetical protein